LMLKIYFYFLSPILRVLFSLAGMLIPKIGEGLRQRKGKPWLKTQPGQRPIVIHCASGEFEYAKPVIRELKRKNPEQKIYVSYFSPSYLKAIETTADVDLAFAAPWDSQGTISEFLDFHKPVAYLISRTDIWPGMTSECHKRGIPTLLFSATLASTSKRMRN